MKCFSRYLPYIFRPPSAILAASCHAEGTRRGWEGGQGGGSGGGFSPERAEEAAERLGGRLRAQEKMTSFVPGSAAWFTANSALIVRLSKRA